MKWFVEELSITGRWVPAIYSQQPEVGKDMRLKRANGIGPKVRSAPVLVDDRDYSLNLYTLQRIYGGANA